MLEWNICKNCGAILDNSQNTCLNCQGDVEKVNIDYLKKYLDNLNFVVKTLNIFTPYCTLTKDMGNIALESLIMDDLFKYFSYLGLGDNEITDNEVEFINSLLDTNFSKEDIQTLTDAELDKSLPASFKCLQEIDEYGQNFDMYQLNSCSELFNCFKLFGKFFITADNELDGGVLKIYSQYINYLESSLKSKNTALKPIDHLNYKPSKKEETHSLDEYLNELNKLVGLEKVKKDVNSLINLVQIRKLREKRGIKQPPMSLHLVFSGNPGTGKTTVARLLSKIYHEIGLLSEGHLIETDRSGLVGGYVGQTAIKTQEVIQSALGGILFIDEAYSLTSKSENDYGLEAVDTLLKAMEDHRDDLIVIVAGYPALMEKFLYSNPGLESRFNKFIYFEDYNEDELYNIFWLMCEESNLTLDEAGDNYIKEYFKRIYDNRSDNFANGRAVRNLFEEVITNQANRLAPKEEISDVELNTLTYQDFLVDENE
ncbi:AAA family ATPase [Methanobrevibacter gottschalkii]|uniref:AAA family ATPase n=1 Tax=Methanobrevibacter gottschalkii TaxID=190974 RepID=UPI0038CF65EF